MHFLFRDAPHRQTLTHTRTDSCIPASGNEPSVTGHKHTPALLGPAGSYIAWKDQMRELKRSAAPTPKANPEHMDLTAPRVRCVTPADSAMLVCVASLRWEFGQSLANYCCSCIFNDVINTDKNSLPSSKATILVLSFP